MKISNIVLHISAEEQLEHFLHTPTHALLLAGDRGTGKTHVSAELARHLLQVDLLENHPYFRVVVGKNESIAIEQIRELIGFFQLKVPGKATIKRAAVIQDADNMGIEAQNALLKLLEEPPADSVLILTSSQPQRLLTTIRSRLQTLTVATPDQDKLKQHLQGLGYDERKIAAALLRSGTNIAEAERLLSSETDTDKTVVLVKQVLGGTAYDRMLLVDGLAKQKGAAQEFVNTLATVASASLQAAAARGANNVTRWRDVLAASHIAQQAFDKSGNAKIVLTELMLAL